MLQKRMAKITLLARMKSLMYFYRLLIVAAEVGSNNKLVFWVLENLQDCTSMESSDTFFCTSLHDSHMLYGIIGIWM